MRRNVLPEDRTERLPYVMRAVARFLIAGAVVGFVGSCLIAVSAFTPLRDVPQGTGEGVGLVLVIAGVGDAGAMAMILLRRW